MALDSAIIRTSLKPAVHESQLNLNQKFVTNYLKLEVRVKQYLDLLRQVLENGRWSNNRTGIPTLQISGAMLQFDLRKGFPAVTTKKLAFNAVKGELIGFIRGYDNAAAFRKLGCNVWDQNANENKTWLESPYRKCTDDLGRIYGRQWRAWDSHGRHPIDQLKRAVETIQADPTSRRIIVNAWNPGELDQMALPPCHMLFQLLPNPETNTLSMCMYQRSCDMFLGVPFNIASYALLLEMISAVTGYDAGELTMFMADVHIYQNHIDQVKLQLTRDPQPLPELSILPQFFERSSTPMGRLEKAEPSDFNLLGYNHNEPIKAEMAV